MTRMLIILALVAQTSPLGAELPLLTSADGRKTLRARPVAAENGKIRFLKAGGRTFLAAPSRFSPEDRERLAAWARAMRGDPRQRLRRRVAGASGLRVLFVGNSYSFQVPKVFENLARAEGKQVSVEQVTTGGWTLARHAAAAATLAKIKNGRWHVVVLQEQSQLPAFPEGQRAGLMDPAVKKLAAAARAAGAQPVLFLTWGRKDGDRQNASRFPGDTYAAMQKRLTQGYEKAARRAGGIAIVPVGRVWGEVLKQGAGAGLYTRDGSHPDRAGNYLAACVFYSCFYGEAVKAAARGVPGAAALAKAAASARTEPLPYPLPAQPVGGGK